MQMISVNRITVLNLANPLLEAKHIVAVNCYRHTG